MLKKITAIYDSATQVYLTPVFMNTKEEAIRSFTETVKGGQNQLSQSPEYFTLFLIGEYDDNKGQFTNLQTPEKLISAHEIDRGDIIGENSKKIWSAIEKMSSEILMIKDQITHDVPEEWTKHNKEYQK